MRKAVVYHSEASATYVVLIEIALFLSAAALTLQQILVPYIKRGRKGASERPLPPVSLTGGKTRSFFLSLLCASNVLRACSLALQIMLHQTVPHSLKAWVTYLFRSSPSLVFLSTYSVVILFWAQVYHAAILVVLPLIRPVFVFMNIAMYTVYVVIALITLLLRAYEEFRTYSIFLVGLLHLAVAFGFAWYGIHVANTLSDRSKENIRKTSVVNRLMFLCVVCPIIFVLKGLYCIGYTTQVIPHYYPVGINRSTWDAVIYIASEWVPSILILLIFWHRRHPLGSDINPDHVAPLVSPPVVASAFQYQLPQPGVPAGMYRVAHGVPGDGPRFLQEPSYYGAYTVAYGEGGGGEDMEQVGYVPPAAGGRR